MPACRSDVAFVGKLCVSDIAYSYARTICSLGNSTHLPVGGIRVEGIAIKRIAGFIGGIMGTRGIMRRGVVCGRGRSGR